MLLFNAKSLNWKTYVFWLVDFMGFYAVTIVVMSLIFYCTYSQFN